MATRKSMGLGNMKLKGTRRMKGVTGNPSHSAIKKTGRKLPRPK